MVWGLRSTLTHFHADEALERLESVLESDNDADWKHAALKAMPQPYIAITLRKLEEHDAPLADKLLDKMRAVMDESEDEDDGLVNEVETLLNYADTRDLHMQLIEDREEALEKSVQSIEITDQQSDARQAKIERRATHNLLDGIRGGSGS